MHSKNIVSGVLTLCFVFVTCILYSDAQKTNRILLFPCELSYQKRNTTSGLAETHSWNRFAKQLIDKSRACHNQMENILCKTLIRRRVLRSLIWVCSVFLCPFFWNARYIWFNTIKFYCTSRNHRHVFPEESANQIHLSYFYSYFCNGKRNRVSKFAYQISQFTGIQSIPGSAFRGYI